MFVLVLEVVLAVDVVLVEVLPLEDVDEEEVEVEAEVALDETLEADAPARSTMNVSIRVEQPNDVSAPSVPSQ